MLTAISRFLTSTLGTVVWCSGTIIFALVALYRLLSKVRPLIRGMNEANRWLLDEKRRTPEAFAREYEEFNQNLREHPLLGHLWGEFSETLVLPRPSERQRIRNSVDAAGFFNMGSVLEGRINLRFYREVANYLPGLGILGTFVGLTAGIYLAQSGLTAEQIEKMREALANLLRGASLAFWTSIVGLVGSLGFSYVEKKFTHRLQIAIDIWCDALDARLERITLEQLGAEQLEQAKQQTVQLERFNTDLATSISAALDERLAGRFAPLLDRTLEALDGLRQERRAGDEALVSRFSPILQGSLEALQGLRSDRQDGNERFVKGMVEEFRKTLTGAAGGEMDAIAQTLRELTVELKSAASTISGAGSNVGKEFEDATRSASSELQRTMETLAASMAARQRETDEAARAASNRMDEQVAKLAIVLAAAASNAGDGLRLAASGAGKELREAAGVVGESVAGVVVDMQKTSQGFVIAVDRLSGAVKDGERVAASARGAFGELQKTVEVLSGVLQSIRQAGEPLGVAGKALNDQLRAQERTLVALEGYGQVLTKAAANVEASGEMLGESWEQVHTRFAGIDTSLSKAFTEINNGVQGFTKSVQGFVQELDTNFARATQLLSGAIQELNEVVEDLSSKK